MTARSAALDSYTRMFHFKCSHNILYLNRTLSAMGLADTVLCSYCSVENETPVHLFFECTETKNLWLQIQRNFPGIPLPNITAESAFIGLPFDSPILIQHMHLIFRICLYKGRERRSCNFQYVFNKLKQTKKYETFITFNNPRKRLKNLEKWSALPENI